MKLGEETIEETKALFAVSLFPWILTIKLAYFFLLGFEKAKLVYPLMHGHQAIITPF